MLALDWDMRTAHSSNEIEELLHKRQGQAQLHNFRLQDKGKFQPRWEQVVDGLSWVSSMFFFETAFGTGSGMLRLTQDQSDGKWKAYAVYTSLQELKGAEEPLGHRRPEGTTESMPDGLAGGTWIERRERQKEFLDSDPTVLVVGAGQAGLNMGARLQNLGLSCLIVDKNERVGDNWRNRYRVSFFVFFHLLETNVHC
jgi:Predicted flavoprotein involved in K+ transport